MAIYVRNGQTKLQLRCFPAALAFQDGELVARLSEFQDLNLLSKEELERGQFLHEWIIRMGCSTIEAVAVKRQPSFQGSLVAPSEEFGRLSLRASMANSLTHCICEFNEVSDDEWES